MATMELELYETLHLLRVRQGLTLRELESSSGIDHATIARMEKGKGEISFQKLQRLAKALGVTMGALCGETPLYRIQGDGQPRQGE